MELTLSDSEVRVDRGSNGRGRSLRTVLADTVRQVLRQADGSAEPGGVVRVVTPLPDVRPLAWLRAQRGAPRFYWRGRERGAAEIAAVGVADEVRGSSLDVLERIRKRRDELVQPGVDELRYFGGCAFDVSAPADDEWSGFWPVWFFLPRFEVRSHGSEQRLVCNLVLPQDLRDPSAVLEAIELLHEGAETREPSLPYASARTDSPDRAGWERSIESALSRLEDHELGKVVLARKAVLSFEDEIDPCVLLDRLAAVTPSCFHFLIEPEAGRAFLGASPERLYRRNGRSIESEAVAGTRPRGTSAYDDKRLRDELLLSDKDRREHQYVERSIREVLQDLTEQLYVDADTSEMTLARGRHLYSGVQGVLLHQVDDIDILRALHPTPAVGGYPTNVAMAAITRLEPFARGWYAGPVGWISRSSSEFAVAIRTGLVTSRRLSLFSGAGIVAGSEAQAEWDEIEHKIGDFTNVLGLDLRRAKY